MWILVTRNRKALCKQAIEAALDTGFKGPCILSQDGCDYEFSYPGFTPKIWPSHVGICHQLHWLLATFPEESHYGILSDDMLPETQNWQKSLEDLAEDRYIANSEDELLHGRKRDGTPWLTTPCYGGELVRTVGLLAIPGAIHQGHDWLYAPLGHRLDLLRYSGVVIRHLHWRNYTRPRDETDNIRPPHDMAVIKAWLDKEFDNVCRRVARLQGRETGGRGETPDPTGLPDALLETQTLRGRPQNPPQNGLHP